jgi:hypothetical protein
MEKSTQKKKKKELNRGLAPNMEPTPSLAPWFGATKLFLVSRETQPQQKKSQTVL